MPAPRQEPIALIGVGCRFPGGADTPAAFWRLLRDGIDVVREVPPERWEADRYYDPDPRAPGKMYSRDGSFLDGIDQFDPQFFRISPREAREMDPQQRLLLEVAWEALEDAGQPPDRLARTPTGVYVGMLGMDYLVLHTKTVGFAGINPYFASGKEFSFCAGRLAHFLDLSGPCLTVTTACSSSLVAVHLACQSLRTRESDLALAGGVSLVLTPELNSYLCQVGAISPTGRCRVFDASADGIVRGEGCGVVVLKRLANALADGDEVLAVLCSTAVNHDGRGLGMTVPNAEAQERLIRQALHEAGLTPADIGYVEAHGTGTPLGDPIEAGALAAVFGPGRPADRPLLLGSAKTNLGHLDAAAGVASLIKAALAVRQGEIPPHLHLHTPNPRIPWARGPLRVPTELTTWERNDGPRRAGVSAFGLSGINAHIVLEEPPAVADEPVLPTAESVLLPLSARDAGALRALAARYRDLLTDDGPSLADVARAAGVRRMHHPYRAAIHARTAAEARTLLEKLSAGETDADLATGVVTEVRPKLAFVVAANETSADLLAPWPSWGIEPDAVTDDGAADLAARGISDVLILSASPNLDIKPPRPGGVVLAPRGNSADRYRALGVLYTRGHPVVWQRVYPWRGRPVRLPNYPWQRASYWLPTATPAGPERNGHVAAEAPVPLAPASMPDRNGSAHAHADVTDLVAAAVADILALDSPRDLDARRGFFDLGMDSITALELKARLEKELGRSLPATLPFDYPTVERLAEHLAGAAPAPQLNGTPEPAPRAPAEGAIAVVGIGCRFPGGADGPEAFWRLLREGRDAVTDIPPGRWDVDAYYHAEPGVRGKMYTRAGAFVDRVDEFDANFFGMPPVEVRSMDPQQRLFLEVAWEALEDAGQPRDRLAGSRTGVYVGLNSTDYQQLLTRRAADVNLCFGTGTSFAAFAGRLGYFLGLHGPGVALDTACSGSLVAIHLACQSLHSGESDLALAGGVNLMLTPTIYLSACDARALAPDGRCKTFDESADGYGRGEGCGVVVLKRLADALADGDEVLAVIAGSAVNQDGASSGLAVPNGAAQEAVIGDAVRRAGIDPAEVDYVEAHGTGTSLGDPIEVHALGRALGPGRPSDRPLWVGSVKTNIGHLEAASGVAGFIKVVLALRHRELPPHLHFRRPSGKIRWDEVPVRVPTAPMPWPAGPGGARVAGVSAFGFTGTNAHVLLREADVPRRSPVAASHRPHLLLLSAATEEALTQQTESFERLLAADDCPPLQDLCFTAAVRRTHHRHRLAVAGFTGADLAGRLEGYRKGRRGLGIAPGAVPRRGARRLAFVFSGYDNQWAGAGGQLLRHEPVFHAAVAECDELIRAYRDWSVLDLLELGRCELVPPELIFTVQVGLNRLWRHYGVEPAAVVGHSMGEVAAAHAAGVLSLEDAVRVLCLRTRLLERRVGRGGMCMVGLPMEDTEHAIAAFGGRVAVAVSNSPRFTVVAGDEEPLTELAAQLRKRNVFHQRINVPAAAHGEQIEALRGELVEQLRDLRPGSAALPVYSSVTAGPLAGADFDADYWGRNLREPVRFAAATRKLVEDGFDTFLELSPNPTLLAPMEQTLRHLQRDGVLAQSLRHEQDDLLAMFDGLGKLHASGFPVDWARLYPAGGRPVPLPSYPWQRQRYWFEDGPADTPPPTTTPLPGRPFRDARRPAVRYWEVEVSPDILPLLVDRRLSGGTLTPPAAYIEQVLTACREAFGPAPVQLRDLTFDEPLILRPGDRATLQLVLSPERGGHAFEIHSLPEPPGDAARRAKGRVERGPVPAVPAPPIPASLDEVPRARLAELADRLGLALESRAGRIAAVRRGAGTMLFEVAVGDIAATGPLPSALLAACVSLIPALDPQLSDELLLPAGVASLWGRCEAGTVRVLAQVRSADGVLTADLRILDEAGALRGEIGGLTYRAAAGPVIPDILRRRLETWLYELSWPPSEPPRAAAAATGTGAWLVCADAGGTGAALAAELTRRGFAVVVAHPGERFERAGDGTFVLDPDRLDDVRRLLREGAPAWAGVAFLWGLDAPADGPGATPYAAAAALHFIQALAAARYSAPPRCWFVTRGAQAVGTDGPTASGVAQAPLWGLGRVVHWEQPGLWGGLIDLDPAGVADASTLAAELTTPDGEDQLAYRGGGRYAARLTRSRVTETLLAPPTLRPDGLYWVSDGLDEAGVAMARWLAARGARHLLVTGSRSPNDAKARPAVEALRSLESAGVRVRLEQVAPGDAAGIVGALTAAERDGPPLRGVVHVAASWQARFLHQLEAGDLDGLFRARAAAAWRLHELTRDRELDLFVLGSSAAALLGGMGVGQYALADSLLGALAEHRGGLGLPALTADWVPWADVGLLRPEDVLIMKQSGLAPFAAADGLEALEYLLATGRAHAAVGDIDWEVMRPFFQAKGAWPVFAEVAAPSPAAATGTAARGELAQKLQALPPAERIEALARHLLAQIGELLGLAPGETSAAQGFFELGMNSIMMVEMKNRLEAALGCTVPVTLAFEYPTCTDLARYLVVEVLHLETAIAAVVPEEGAATDEPELSDAELMELLDRELSAADSLLAGPEPGALSS